MVKRGLSAIVGIGVFLALCFGGLLPFAIGATIIAGLATQEWISAYQHAQKVEAKAGDTPRLPKWLNNFNVVLACLGIAFPLYVYSAFDTNAVFAKYDVARTIASTWVGKSDWTGNIYLSPVAVALLIVPVCVFSVLVIRAARSGNALGILRRWHGVVAVAYIGILMSSLVLLRVLHGPTRYNGISVMQLYVAPFGVADWGAWLVLFVAACVWMTDTGAYFFGKAFGKHKLAPRLSPGKTIEGSLGGLCAALLTGALFGLWIHLPLRDGLAVGFIAGTMGQVGDLFESALKREIGLKDFGSIMPGHGGALDRFDSLLFVAPLAFCYLHFLAKL
jgi:phosphatidate cytidylyltransferase